MTGDQVTRILLHGCNGRMGRAIVDLCSSDPSVTIAAGVDAAGTPSGDFPFFSSLDACDIPTDVMIDFSNAAATDAVLSRCVADSLPLVLCTTGLSEEQLARVTEASKTIPILRSANMSVGVNVVLDILREAAPKLYDAGFDIEIVEKHHNRKLDAPSGTAIAMADEINDSLKHPLPLCMDRHERRQVREHDEIGISAVRGGTIVGDHDIIFAGTDEVVTISHSAYSRAIFAKGAVTAAAFLPGQPAGLYSMRDALRR